MQFVSVFFLALSVLVLLYLAYVYIARSRAPLLLEIFYLIIYSIIVLIVLFPQILSSLEQTFGIQSALNFIIYLSIFIAYFLIFVLYQEKEIQRQEITKLTREIALEKKQKGDKKWNKNKNG